jgi:hypothetical protein
MQANGKYPKTLTIISLKYNQKDSNVQAIQVTFEKGVFPLVHSVSFHRDIEWSFSTIIW